MAVDKTDAMAPPDAKPPEARATIGGKYELDLARPLAVGSMCHVYLGRDSRTRRLVAIKTLRLEYRDDPESRARFRHEARLLAFLAHPNVVRVYDFVEDRGTSWVVMEYVNGRSLAEVLAERGPLAPAEVVPLLDQTAAALAHLHAHGLVHLDVSPHNIFVTEDGSVKLIDFGLAQPIGGPQVTITRQVGGNAVYRAPEQIAGEPVDIGTDVYALGCVVYELVAGRPPFPEFSPGDRDNPRRTGLDQGPEPPSRVRPDLDLPVWVDDTVLLALAKNPSARYSSVESFANLFRSGPGQAFVEDDDEISLRRAALPLDKPRLVARGGLMPPRAGVAARSRRPPRLGDLSRSLARAGTRLARNAAAVAAGLWRVVAVVAAIDLLLAVLLFLSRGVVPGFYEPAPTLQPGASGIIVIDRALVRAGPGQAAAPVATLNTGDRITITGPVATTERKAWWPIVVSQDGATITGFVAGESLQAVRVTPLERLRAWLPG